MLGSRQKCAPSSSRHHERHPRRVAWRARGGCVWSPRPQLEFALPVLGATLVGLCWKMLGMSFSLPIPAEANALLNKDPLAVVIGMVLDQQIPLEKAFSSPYVLAERLGPEPAATELAGFDPEALVAIFATPPALHRFPKAMAGRVQEVCRVLT